MDSESDGGSEEIASGTLPQTQTGRIHQSASPPTSPLLPSTSFIPSSLWSLDHLPKGFQILKADKYPHYQQIVDAQSTLPQFSLDQLRALQNELAIISDHAHQTQLQIEKEKADLEKWLKQQKMVTPAPIEHSESDVPVSPSKAEDRKIRLNTPLAREPQPEIIKKKKLESDPELPFQEIEKKRKIVPEESVPLSDPVRASSEDPNRAKPSAEQNFQLIEFPPTDPAGEKKKKKKNDPKVRRRGGKGPGGPGGPGGKSVSGSSGKNAQDDTENQEGAAEEEDGSKAKVGNQVSFDTFMKFLDTYTRPITEEDLSLLEVTEDDPYPYIVPRLGKRYSEQWHQDFMNSDAQSSVPLSPTSGTAPETTLGATWKSDDPWCKPLTQRILAALVDEQLAPDLDKMEEDERPPNWKCENPTPDYYDRLEDRIKDELRHLGLLGEEETSEVEREDDEITFQLRYLQECLRKQVSINNARKAKIYERARPYLAFQEYELIVSDVHKQVEKIHWNRLKSGKKGKKKEKLKTIPEQSVKLMEESEKLLKKLAKVFPREKFKPPKEPIFEELSSEPNQNPFAYLDTLHFNGLPPSNHETIPSIVKKEPRGSNLLSSSSSQADASKLP